MPFTTLDLSKPEVYEMLSDSAIYWIKRFDLDGFRHDATKHIPEIFWRTGIYHDSSNSRSEFSQSVREKTAEIQGRF